MMGESRYEIRALLGEGTYGKVFKALDRVTNTEVAIKRIKTSTTAGTDGGFHFTSIREIKVMKAVKHENVVTLIDLFAGAEQQLNLVMPLLQLDLKQVISDRSVVLSMAHVKCIMKQVLAGLNALHLRWFLSRDLAPANVLVNPATGTCLIADFGLSRTFGTPFPGILGRRRTFAGVMTSMVVTLWYRAPELLFGAQHYGAGVDIWAAGCVFAELLPRPKEEGKTHQLRQPLFPGANELDQLQKIFELLGTPSEVLWKDSVNFPKFQRFTHLPPLAGSWPIDLFPQIADSAPDTDTLLMSMLSLDPNFRPSAKDLLEHEYFTSIAPRPCSEAALAKQVFAHVATRF
jgi:cyclin-dependent kinase 7